MFAWLTRPWLVGEPGPRLQAWVAAAVVAAMALATVSFFLSAIPLGFALIATWDRWRPIARPEGPWLLGFLALSLVVAPWVTDRPTHLASLAGTYGLWIVYWRVVSGTPLAPRFVGWIWRGVALTGALLALIGMANGLGTDHVWQWGELPWRPGLYLLDLQFLTGYQRASGFTMNPNVLAALLVLTWPVALRLATDAPTRRLQWAWLAVMLLQWVGLLLSQSRGAVIALLAVAGTWAWREPGIRRHLGTALGGLVVLLALSLPAWSPLLHRLETLADPGHRSNQIRVALARSGVAMVLDAPLQGLGVGTFAEQYPRYQYPEDTANCPHLHNWYLQVASESGLPAAVLFFGAIGMIAWRGHRIGSVGAESTLGLGLFSLTDYLFHDARVALIAWTLWGLTCRDPEQAPPGPTELASQGSQS